ncbi:MAG: DNA primase [Thermoproteota archaeon]|jgi:DNA primase|uniref:DNA primase DnaG n=1 Tax=Candidatus Methanodesulfokora washburnensis TaxID=2478471 RepID=A0A3R9RQH8_9CREN|nr:DNA primase DnaG [Candidatus Methanodesulfokores washburnensis]RSN76143.1 DNA primase [Candidatus Methanodesulfokores washburnensis]RZN62210.1 MAG: DNA primase [Candidatus Methanodesulfokores washburnensis]TDA37686.1 MAG: DNA primase [Candidatus Korarchaeota archaeon]
MGEVEEQRQKLLPHKYVARLHITINGVVDPSDVIGAIFGQLEGLLGPELELKELQRTGKVGRIYVKLKKVDEKSEGIIMFPSGLDRVSTALLVAAMETIDKVGPYPATVTLKEIVDEREERRKEIAKRAAEILKSWTASSRDYQRKILDMIRTEAAKASLVLYGKEGLPAAKGVEEAEEIIVVEGRADVLNMIRYGYSNVIAVGGAVERIPDSLVDLIRRKYATAFVDGDRGGELVLRSLLEQTDIDFVARAPNGKGVEELTAKEIKAALSSAVPADEVAKELGIRRERRKEVEKKLVEVQAESITEIQEEPQVKASEIQIQKLNGIPEPLRGIFQEIAGKEKAVLLGENFDRIAEIPISELYNSIGNIKDVKHIVYDGIVTQRIIDKAYQSGVRTIVGAKIHEVIKIPAGLRVITLE